MCAGNARLIEHVRQADLGVEQHGRDVGRESAHEIELESAERLVVEREARRPSARPRSLVRWSAARIPRRPPGVESWSSARLSATVNILARFYQI